MDGRYRVYSNGAAFEDDPAANFGRRDQPAHGSEDDPDADHQEQDPVDVRGEDLEAAEPERPAPSRRSQSSATTSRGGFRSSSRS